MAINKVGSKGIEDGSVASADFAPNTVTSAKLQDGAVTNAKLTNTSVTLTGSSVSLGGSVSFNNKFVDWQSVITADGSTFNTAVSGQGYFIDTTSAAHTITLPASASAGDSISIKDYAGTFATNNLTIARNGHNIQGVANDSLISTNRASLVLVYVDATKGWLFTDEHNVAELVPTFITATGGTITDSGDFKIHSFTGDGCFVVSSLGNPLSGPEGSVITYLVVAGGGGTNQTIAGGGGAGGLRLASCFSVTSTTYPVTVGGGGSHSPGSSCGGGRGSNSVFSTITSTGGGGSGASIAGPGPVAASAPQPGGSGGGGTARNSAAPATGFQAGGTGNTPPVSPSQGNPGGNSSGAPNIFYALAGGGGGGAGAAGGNGTINPSPGPNPTYGAGGDGGNGVDVRPTFGPSQPFYISGPGAGYFAGGGSGGNSGFGPNNTGYNGTGGLGGGGMGYCSSAGAPQPGAVENSGGGAGGGRPAGVNGNGGKGIVIIRYKFQ